MGDIKEKRIALLSNINVNPLLRILQGEVALGPMEGYGNELGIMMNPASAYNQFAPEITFLIMDLMELTEHELTDVSVKNHVENWFSGFENAMQGDRIYYISDAYLWGPEQETADMAVDRGELEGIWKNNLKALCGEHENVRILPYHRMLTVLGEENAFSLKMWYMGKILLSGEAQKRLAALILDKIRLEYRTPKKVLLLDLDNTLWGGLAGEHDNSPIILSDDHGGLAYKNLQRVILQMQKQGVLLGIVSKNNPEDAEEILQHHPHMVLRPECFAAKRINWKPKNENILEIAGELNLGTDSFVFWDDNPEERMLVRQMLPEVTVPDFPEKPEDLAAAMTDIYHTYFEKAVLTAEDLEKTAQYAANAKRTELRKSASNFYEYLKQLKITVTRVETGKHMQRLEALINKTNQFNLTTRRHDLQELLHMDKDPDRSIFLYQVKDCFGDNGVVAAVIVDTSAEIPTITEFVMSCRVMGKNVEQGILKDVELEMMDRGYRKIRGLFLPTAKNKPVAEFYTGLGYEQIGEQPDGTKVYEIELAKTPVREFMGQLVIENIKQREILLS